MTDAEVRPVRVPADGRSGAVGRDEVARPLAPSVRLPPEVCSVRVARAALRAALAPRRGAAVEDAELLVGEVVTNAVLHARTPFEMRILGTLLDDERLMLRVEVTDGSPEMPVLRRPDPQSITGRGLFIVSMFARSRGVDPVGEAEGVGGRGVDGKTVWFEVVLPPST